MPELPEVETTRRGLAPHLEGRRIATVRLPPRAAPDRQFAIGQRGLDALTAALILLPVLLLAGAFALWLRRRRR